MNNQNKNLNKFIKISLLGAIAALLMLIEIPLIPMFSWLKMDISELPVLMGAFAFGPMAGVVIEIIKLAVNTMFTGSGTGFVGEIANFIIGVSFVIPASFIYHRNKSKKSAILGMIIGGLFMEIAGVIANIYILLPAYGMAEHIDLNKYVMVGLIPFNGIKAILISVVTYLVYKKVSVAIFKVDDGFGSKTKLIE